MIRSFQKIVPQIDDTAFVAENAAVIGNVVLEKDSSVWFGAVLRGDGDTITVGAGSNVQDCAVLHCDHGKPLTLGSNVTVGHSAIVHGAQVGDDVLIGMHATLLDGCVIGAGSIIGAGALVKENAVIPPRSLVVGVPAKVIRAVGDAQAEDIRKNARHYIELAKAYKA